MSVVDRRSVSSLHGLSDLKLTGDGGFVAVSDSGDLVRGRLELDADGKLSGLHDLRPLMNTRLNGTLQLDEVEA